MAMRWVALALFGLAVLHTFLVKQFQVRARRYPEGSIGKNFFHLLSEVEIIFGFWAGVLLLLECVVESPSAALAYLESRNFAEPVFVFVVLSLCATQPVLDLAEGLIEGVARVLPFRRATSFLIATLTVGPLLGSFITEPAAMTVTAWVLFHHFYQSGASSRFKYAILGVLFVNISIGGTLTPYAAPPVLMVARQWNWSLAYMLLNFGWKGALAVALSSFGIAFYFRRELGRLSFERRKSGVRTPFWLKICHLLFLIGVVASAHHPILVMSLFLFFLGFVHVTMEHQAQVRLKEGLLVAFFLGGLVVIGGFQGWWLEQILVQLSAFRLFLGAIVLTAFADNAALTYLGSLVPSLSEASRYALVSGAIVGGGLTVIANAPNPIGYSILRSTFGEEGISPLGLLLAALPPTFIAAICYWVL